MRDEREVVLEAIRRMDNLIGETKWANKKLSQTSSAIFYHHLNILSKQLKRVLDLSDGHSQEARKIGVFGPPKRGKSTLLNVLLGDEILPTARTPKTHCVVEIHNKPEAEDKPRLILYKKNGGIEPLFKAKAPDINATINECFDGKIRDVTRVEVHGDFRSSLFPENSILVDTPGAEAAFEESPHDETMGTWGRELSEDTRRALEILDDTDVVFFCMRADQLGSETEYYFYNRYMKNIKPINIVNMKDKVNNSGEVPDEEITLEAAGKYGFDYRERRDTVAVSALEGMDAIKVGHTVPSNSGFQELYGKIQERLEFLEPPEALENAVIEYNTVMDSHRYLNAPLRTVVKRFTEKLNGFGIAARVLQDVEKSVWYQDMFGL
jgi:GTPase Era involved in 16S rRNA processing